MCDGTNHQMIEIYRSGYADDDINNVVRWCNDCGAVTVDQEYDGRVLPGRSFMMRFPTMIYKNQKVSEI